MYKDNWNSETDNLLNYLMWIQLIQLQLLPDNPFIDNGLWWLYTINKKIGEPPYV